MKREIVKTINEYIAYFFNFKDKSVDSLIIKILSLMELHLHLH